MEANEQSGVLLLRCWGLNENGPHIRMLGTQLVKCLEGFGSVALLEEVRLSACYNQTTFPATIMDYPSETVHKPPVKYFLRVALISDGFYSLYFYLRMYMSACLYVHACAVSQGVQERASDPPELELQEAVMGKLSPLAEQ